MACYLSCAMSLGVYANIGVFYRVVFGSTIACGDPHRVDLFGRCVFGSTSEGLHVSSI